MSTKKLADEATDYFNVQMENNADSRSASVNDVYAAAMICRIQELEEVLIRFRDCDFVISLPDRMDAVRDIARKALTT